MEVRYWRRKNTLYITLDPRKLKIHLCVAIINLYFQFESLLRSNKQCLMLNIKSWLLLWNIQMSQMRKQVKPALQAAGRSEKSFCAFLFQLCCHTEIRLDKMKWFVGAFYEPDCLCEGGVMHIWERRQNHQRDYTSEEKLLLVAVSIAATLAALLRSLVPFVT